MRTFLVWAGLTFGILFGAAATIVAARDVYSLSFLALHDTGGGLQRS